MSTVLGCEVVYIAGSGRSGSTLLERALGASPGWVNVGELIELFRQPEGLQERCGCGEPFATCPVWSEVGRLAADCWSPEVVARIQWLQSQVSRQRLIPQLLATRRDSGSELARNCREYADRLGRIYRAVAEATGAEVVVDASKWPGQALALQLGGVPVRLVHAVRDPRGVAHSWAKSGLARPQSSTGATMASRAPWESAARWVAMQTEVRAMAHRFEHSSIVRYEDFVGDPAATLARARRDLGFDDTPEALGHIGPDAITLPASHGVAGNPSRFESGTVTLRPDVAWTSALATRDRRVVSILTAPVLLAHGYPVRARAVTPSAEGRPATRGTAITDPPLGGWPRVAVVLPTRGRPELLREAVVSVLDQDYAGDIDVVVVHDQEDPHRDLLELAGPGRTVRLLRNDHTPGLAGARNTGIDHIDHEFVASCDDDDFWDRNKLRLQMARMVGDPDLGVLGAGIRLLMSEEHVVDWPGDSPDITPAQLWRSRRKELHSSTLVVRRAVYLEVGGYDEALPSSYAEDYEFLLRAIEVANVGVINQPLASVRKYNASWFRDRAEVVANALEYLLEQHPEIANSRAGHARVLGQIAFARSTMGQRRRATALALRALVRWPASPHAMLALVHATTGTDPRVLLGTVRKVGRGIT